MRERESDASGAAGIMRGKASIVLSKASIIRSKSSIALSKASIVQSKASIVLSSNEKHNKQPLYSKEGKSEEARKRVSVRESEGECERVKDRQGSYMGR